MQMFGAPTWIQTSGNEMFNENCQKNIKVDCFRYQNKCNVRCSLKVKELITKVNVKVNIMTIFFSAGRRFISLFNSNQILKMDANFNIEFVVHTQRVIFEMYRGVLVSLKFCNILVSARFCSSLCSVLFSCFKIEIVYSNFIFLWRLNSQFACVQLKLSKFQENEHTQEFPMDNYGQLTTPVSLLWMNWNTQQNNHSKLTSRWMRMARLSYLPQKLSTGVAPEVNLRISLQAGDKAWKLGDPHWLWNPEHMSPEVQNRGISGPTKSTDVLHFLKKKQNNHSKLFQQLSQKFLQNYDVQHSIRYYYKEHHVSNLN